MARWAKRASMSMTAGWSATAAPLTRRSRFSPASRNARPSCSEPSQLSSSASRGGSQGEGRGPIWQIDSLPLAACRRFRLRQGYGGRNVSTLTRRSFSGDGPPGMTNFSIENALSFAVFEGRDANPREFLRPAREVFDIALQLFESKAESNEPFLAFDR